jgi:hypothetical protein
MPPRTAIFYSENPLAIVRDFPSDAGRAQALNAIERALSRIAADDQGAAAFVLDNACGIYYRAMPPTRSFLSLAGWLDVSCLAPVLAALPI